MFTKKALDQHINAFLEALQTEAGYKIERAVLYGSYAKGGVKPTSDIDLALWSPSFEGSLFVDLPPIVTLVSRFHPISIRPFPANATKEEYPFVEEILRTGIEIPILQNA